MAVSYKKLFDLIDQKKLNKNYLRKNGIHSTVVDKLIKNKIIDTTTIGKICELLQVQPGDIMTYSNEPDNISNNADNSEVKQINKTPQKRRESVKLDQILKLLFDVSKTTLVNALNGLFDENYNPADVDVKISKTATEFIKDNFDVIRADTFLKIIESNKPHHYHIEYQLKADEMVIRMFEYDIQKALENKRMENNNGKTILYMPKSLVIHFEESDSIPDKYTLEIVFADGDVKEYAVDVMKYWNFDDNKLIDKKLYNLLPLQLFLLRAELETASKKKDKQSKQNAILKAKNTAEKIANIVTNLYEEHKIDLNDYDKIINGLAEIFRHLNNRYKLNQKLNTEVDNMVKTLIDKNVVEQTEQRKTIEIIIRAIKKGLSLEDIADLTNFDINKIKEIQEQQIAD